MTLRWRVQHWPYQRLQDADGVYRHLPLLLKIDTAYLPTLSLSMFLDAVKVPFEAAHGATGVIP